MNKDEFKTAMEATGKWTEVGTPVLSTPVHALGFAATTKQYEIPTLIIANSIATYKVFTLWVVNDGLAGEAVYFIDQDPTGNLFTTFKDEVITYMDALSGIKWSFRNINVVEEWATVQVFKASDTNPATHISEMMGRVYKVSGTMTHRIIE